MAPEILATHLGHINGYDCRIDWWSLGITFFEFLRGRQPYEFTSSSTTNQMLQMILKEAYLIPSHWSSDLIAFIKSIMHIDIQKRITSLDAFRKHRYMERIDFDSVLARRISPIFVPKQNKLNCDPSYELEERIVESSPLHKHYRRKQNKKRRENHNSATTSADIAPSDVTDKLSSHNTAIEEAIQEMSNSFTEYNRFCANRTSSLNDCPTQPSPNQTNLQTIHCPSKLNNNNINMETVC